MIAVLSNCNEAEDCICVCTYKGALRPVCMRIPYQFEAEQGIGTRGVVFTFGGRPRVLVENLALEGNGVFTRSDR